MTKILLMSSLIVGFNGCSQMMPYKTSFDCNAEPTGHCGSLTENIKKAYSFAGLTGSISNENTCNSISYEINNVTLGVEKRSRYE